MLNNDGTLKTTTIKAPTFGQAVIKDIISQRPTTSGKDQTDIKQETGRYFTLDGVTFENTLAAIAVVTTVPVKGQLYQVGNDGSTVGDQITVSGTIVTNPNNKVYYYTNQYAFPIGTALDVITYEITDSCQNSDSQSINLIVYPVPHSPTASNAVASVNENGEVSTSVDIQLNFADVDKNAADNTPQSLSVSLISNPDNSVQYGGSVLLPNNWVSVGTARSLIVKFVPKMFDRGVRSFQYKVRDSTNLESAPATVTVTVLPVNQRPSASVGTPVTGKENFNTTITIYGSDIDSASVSFKILSVPSKGLLYDSNWNLLGVGSSVAADNGPTAIAQSVLYYSPQYLDFSCDPDNGDYVNATGITCSPTVTFSFQATDNEAVYSPKNALSDTVDVDVYIFHVNQAPTAPADVSITMVEDTLYTIQLNASDVDANNPFYSLSFFITNWPYLETLYQHGTTDVITNSSLGSLITDTLKRVDIVPDANVFGDPANDFQLTAFAYKAYDGKLFSNTAKVHITLQPVNDAPVATLHNISTIENTVHLVELTATDIDSDPSEFTYKITALPDVLTGTLYLYNESASDLLGEAIDTVGTIVPFTTCGNDGELAACVFFVAATDYWGSSSFGYSVTDTDMYPQFNMPNGIPLTDTATIDVTVIPVNHAPVATMQTPTLAQDTILIFVLAGQDTHKESDSLQPVVMSALYSTSACTKVGKLFQYDDNLAQTRTAYLASGVEINSNYTDVTDTQFRVVYVPDEDVNSVSPLVPFTYVVPWFSYYVKEISKHAEPSFLTSQVNALTIELTAVNEDPVVFQDSWVGTEFTENITVCYTTGSTCTFPENLGRSWRDPATTVPISFGGNDRERSPLTVVLTAVTCPTTATLQTFGSDPVDVPRGTNLNFQLPTVINLNVPTYCEDTYRPPNLIQGLSFAPGLDDVNPASGAYCSITYKVVDNQGASSATKTIEINITPVNQLPRPDGNQFLRVEQFLEGSTWTGTLGGYDPEGATSFDLEVLSCDPNQGVITIEDETVDCTPGKKITGNGSWKVTYTPPAGLAGVAMNTLLYTFTDADLSTVVTDKDQYAIEWDVIAANSAPVLTPSNLGTVFTMENGYKVFSEVNLKLGAGVQPVFVVSDADLNDNDAFVTVTVSVDTSASMVMTFTDAIEQDNTTLSYMKIFSGSVANVNQALATLSLSFDTENPASYNLYITVNDNGNFGACMMNDTLVDECPMTDSVRVPIQTAKTGSYITAAAGGAAAGAFALAGLIGAGAWKKLSKTEPGYEPWKALSTDFTHESPLYDNEGRSGVNALYE